MIETRSKTLPTMALLAALATLPATAGAGVVGDADGDGEFALADLLLVQRALAAGFAETGPEGLSDVAEPCGQLDAADQARLALALQAAGPRVPAVESSCHGEAVGAELPPPAPTTPVTLDDLFWEIAREVPEFGGLYFDGQGQATVVLTNVGALADAEAAVFARFDYERLGTDMLTPVPGDYGFLELFDWRRSARDVLTLTGVTGLEIDEVKNRVWVGLVDADHQAQAEAYLDGLGVPLDAVDFEETGAVELSAPPDYKAQWRPMRAGIQVGWPIPMTNFIAVCSMGPIVERSGQRGWLSNSHCTPTIGAVDGVTFFQPGGSAPADFAGVETSDPPLFTSATQSSCPSGQMCRWSDAAFMQASFAGTTRLGRILTDTPAWNARKVVGKEYFPLVGDPVSKSGQETGQTSGHVTKTCIDVPPGDEVTFTILCQHGADFHSKKGDSGAPVYRETYPDTAILYGLYWGRYKEPPDPLRRMFSGVANLEADLGFLHVDAAEGHPKVEFITPTNGENLGPGSFFQIPLSVSVGDHEDGVACAGCWVDWTSTVDGYLDGAPVLSGIADGQATLTGQGKRFLWAHAVDSAGAPGYELVQVSTEATAAPDVWIDSPAGGAVLAAGIDTMVAGNSFDPDTWEPLPCSSLVWSTGDPADGTWQGCSPIVQFSTPGPRILTLTGTDAQNVPGVDQVQIDVVAAAATGPPYVTILAPHYNAFLPRTAPVTLSGKAVDPDGESPIQYEWVIHGSAIFGGGPAVIGTAGGNDGETVTLTWTPADHVAITCGGVPLQLELRAVDADDEQGSVTQPIYIGDPPC